MTQKADTKLRREPELGSHDFKLACEFLDAGKICHVGFTLDDQPYVVPMAYARMDDQLLLHGSVASRLVKNLATRGHQIRPGYSGLGGGRAIESYIRSSH